VLPFPPRQHRASSSILLSAWADQPVHLWLELWLVGGAAPGDVTPDRAIGHHPAGGIDDAARSEI